MEEWVKSLKNFTVLSGEPEKEELKAISYDSRTAKAGDLFLCMKGTKLDSHDRILELIHKGVRIFVVEKELLIASAYSAVNELFIHFCTESTCGKRHRFAALEDS